MTTNESPAWVVDALRIFDAIALLGPLRSGFSIADGFKLDGRRGVAAADVMAAAEKRARQLQEKAAAEKAPLRKP